MEPIEFLRILRLRWRVLVACAVVLATAAFVVSPASVTASGSTRHFRASAVLLAVTGKRTSTTNLSQDALLMTIGVVPRRAAEQLHVSGNPARLVAQVKTAIDLKVQTITISTRQPTAARASMVANTFAEQLVAYLRDVAKGQFNLQVVAALSRQTTLENLLVPLRRQLDGLKALGQTNAILEARYTAWLGQLRTATAKYQALVSAGVDTDRYRLIETTNANPAAGSGLDIGKLGGRKTRVLLALLLGLLLGGGLALLLDRFDLRVRTKRDAELAFGLPVVSEIPALWYGSRRRREVITAVRPISPYAEVHRILRHSLLFAQMGPYTPGGENGNGQASGYAKSNGHANANGNGHSNGKSHANGNGYADVSSEPNGNGDAESHATGSWPARPKGRQVIIVTSAGSAEGKTTTVANLAASFAESGQSVLVMSCDFHGPRIQQMLGVEESPGIANVLHGGVDAPSLAEVTVETTIPGVWLAPSGGGIDNPPELASSVGPLMTAARELADIVIIDTPALLSVSAASELLPAADVAVIVARSARTTREAAVRVNERLHFLGAPVLGVVLVGPQIPSVSREYSGYSRPPGGWWKRRRLLRKRGIQIGARAEKLGLTEPREREPAGVRVPADVHEADQTSGVTQTAGDATSKPRWRRREARQGE